MVNIRKMKKTRPQLGDSYGFGALLLYYWSVRERMGHQGWNNSFWCAVNGWVLALKWCLIPLYHDEHRFNHSCPVGGVFFFSMQAHEKVSLNECTPPIKDRKKSCESIFIPWGQCCWFTDRCKVEGTVHANTKSAGVLIPLFFLHRTSQKTDLLKDMRHCERRECFNFHVSVCFGWWEG